MEGKDESELIANELAIAEQIKRECDENGKERDPSKTANLFHKLGLIYEQRSPDMICLIKSATLLNAAIARKPDNLLQIQNDLRLLCNHVLHIANAKQKSADLIKEANEIKKGAEKMRERVTQSLENVAKIPNNLEEEKLMQMEEEKVNQLKDIQAKVTDDYKHLMANISEYCVEVMGKAPCDFTHVGMGSMARSEITPYSDYENIIVLEEGCQKNEDTYCNKILPYFRWYSVIFQLILINLKETILPSVAIKSLNDTTTKRGNWFFDAYSTRGISFDGMMPHACKSPLGRQQPTQLKPWKTELIKPVSEMLKYLETEQDLKNGYHLSDILRNTCFVFGEKSVYDRFRKGVDKTLRECDKSILRTRIKTQIKEDIESFGTKFCLSSSESKQSFNFKRIVYRSTTLFISTLGQLYNAFGNSCFEVIEGLKEVNLLSDYAKRKLEYSVAVACEIRLRFYMKSKAQIDWITKFSESESIVVSLVEHVGQSSCINYFQIAYALQCDICHKLNIKRSHFYSDLGLLNMSICEFLGMKEAAKSLLELCANNLTIDSEFRGFDSCLKDLEKGMKISIGSKQAESNSMLFKAREAVGNYYFKICKMFHEESKYNEAVEFGKRYLDMVRSESGVTDDLSERAEILHKVGDSCWQLSNHRQALDHFKEGLEVEKKLSAKGSPNARVAESLHQIGKCFMRVSRYKEAKEYFKKSLKIKENAEQTEEAERSIASSLNNLGLCLISMSKHKKAMVYLRRSIEIKQRISPDQDTDRDLKTSLNNIGWCLLMANQYKEAIFYVEKAMSIVQRTSANEETDKSMPPTLNTLGLCLVETSQYKKAIYYLQKSLKIRQLVSMDEDVDRAVANTLYLIGLWFYHTSQYKEAFQHFEKSLNIYLQITLDESIDRDVAKIFDILGLCYKDLNQYEKSLDYFKKALKIYQQSSENETKDNCVSSVLLHHGLCFICKGHYKEACENIETALENFKQTTEDEETDRNVAHSFHGLGLFMMETDDKEKALKLFKKARKIYEKTSIDKNWDRNVAVTLHDIGMCLKGTSQNSLVMEHLQKSLAIFQQISMNEEADRHVARGVQSIGLHFMDECQYDKALTHLEKALKIWKNISLNIETDVSVACVGLLNDITFCKKKACTNMP